LNFRTVKTIIEDKRFPIPMSRPQIMNVIVIINIMKYSLIIFKSLTFSSVLFDAMTRLQADYRGRGRGGASILGKGIKDPLACLVQTVSGTENCPFLWVPGSTSLAIK
jgi:hypothetical protein